MMRRKKTTMIRRKRRLFLLVTILFAVLFTGFLNLYAEEPAYDDAVLRMSEQLVLLRSEVEALSQRLDAKKSEMQERLRAVNSQKAELEAQKRNEELRLKQLETTIGQASERIEKTFVSRDYLVPVLERNCELVRRYIEESVPFKVKERLEEVDSIASQISRKTISPEKALAQLWSLLEDEFRLSGEHGLYKQPIVVDGREMIADVVRLGMIMMYFRTADGTVGRVVRSNDTWRYLPITDNADRERVEVLFDAMKKRIREGYFELPTTFIRQDG